MGHGGAVASVDADASAAGIEVLRKGGNAVDAAVATAAALGVTEPYSSGVGGGGYFVYYDARSRTVHTIDGRETAPLTADENLFVEDGKPLAFADAVTSGLGVGTPGTPATWQTALDRWGRQHLGTVLAPAERLARKGFTVDETFRSQTASNEARFRNFPATAKLFLPGGRLPVVGSTFTNPDLARTYRELARKGVGAIYRGDLGEDIVATVRKPPVDPASGYNARPGKLSRKDLTAYRAKVQAPTRTTYRGLGVYSIAPPPPAAPPSARRSTSWSGATSPRRAAPSTCTATSRRAASPSRTGAAGWAIPPSRTSPPRSCSPSGSPAPAAASSRTTPS